MNVLYLLEGNTGVGNIYMNVILILTWIIITNKYDKLVLIASRLDAITNFCNNIQNDKFEIINSRPKHVPKNSESVKAFLKSRFYGEIYSDIESNLKITHDKSGFTNVYFYGFTRLTSNQLLLTINYFNPVLNEEMTNIISSLKKENYIALHIRGTDFVTEILKTTEDQLTYDHYFNFIENSKCDNIYLATDDKMIRKKFTDKYKEKIFFYSSLDKIIKFGNVIRTTDALSIYVDIFMCRDAIDFMGTPKSTFSDFIKLLKFFKNN